MATSEHEARFPVISFARRMLRERPLRLALIVLCSTVASVLEGIGLTALVPLLDLVQGSQTPTASSVGTLGSMMLRAFDWVGIGFELGPLLGVVFAIMLVSQSVVLLQQKVTLGTAYAFEAGLRERLYAAVFRAGWPFFLKEKSSELLNALTTEAGRARSAFTDLAALMTNGLLATVYVAVAVAISLPMTALVATGGVVVTTALRFRVARGRDYGHAATEGNAELQGEALEHLSGAKLIKASAAEAITLERFAEKARWLAGLYYRAGMNRHMIKVSYDIASLSLVFLGILAASMYLHVPLSSLLVFLFIFYRLSPRLNNMIVARHEILVLLPGLAVIDQEVGRAEAVAEPTGGEPVAPLERAIELRDVSFGYAPDRLVVRALDIEIPRGKTTAIVGPSGVGKTTVIDLVMKLVEPTGGEILVDDRPLAALDTTQWRGRIGYVGQDPVMFHASVRENIAWATPDASAEDVAAAARFAHADEFVGQLSQGYETLVGDRGTRLSGGQKQRLALARAVLRGPDILILDEATSALDPESERAIQQAISSARDSMTVVTVTHRLATVRDADLIYVLDNGSVVEHGIWDDLMAANGRFAELKRLQDLEGKEAPVTRTSP